jgi:hypothetical protein
MWVSEEVFVLFFGYESEFLGRMLQVGLSGTAFAVGTGCANGGRALGRPVEPSYNSSIFLAKRFQASAAICLSFA